MYLKEKENKNEELKGKKVSGIYMSFSMKPYQYLKHN